MKNEVFSNITDYVQTQFNTFKEKKFSEVDSLILSNFCYINLDELVPGVNRRKKSIEIKDILKAEYFDKMLKDVRLPDEYIKFIYAMAASPRFRNVKLTYYINKMDNILEKQFSATTFILNENEVYIGYRGTDASIIGWKEDFNMSYKYPISSQLEAKEYLDIVYKLVGKRKIYMGGHSKGGNLAVYALVKCDKKIQDRIECVFSHDGPGFREEFIQSKEFEKQKIKIRKTVPQSSIIGMILQTQENYNIVKSNNKGIMQHEPFSWEIENSDFKYVEDLTSTSKYTNKTLSKWLDQMTDERREIFVDTLFDIILSTKSTTVNELSENWKKNIPIMFEKIKTLDPDIKEAMLELLKELSKDSIASLDIKLPKNPFIKFIRK